LFTRADAEKILGKPVKDAEHPVSGSETFNVSSCAYHVQGGTAMDGATLILTIPSERDLTTAKTAFESGKNMAQANYNAAPVDVPGVGDSAFWVGGAGNNISILKSVINVNLSASTQKGDNPTAANLELAKIIIGRLP
jgi:hypothetical protein